MAQATIQVQTFVQYNIKSMAGADESLILVWGPDASPLDISDWDFLLTVKNDVNDPDSKAVFKANPEDCTKSSSGRDEAETVDTVTIPYQTSANPLAGKVYAMDVKRVVAGKAKPFIMTELDLTKGPTDRVESDA